MSEIRPSPIPAGIRALRALALAVIGLVSIALLVVVGTGVGSLTMQITGLQDGSGVPISPLKWGELIGALGDGILSRGPGSFALVAVITLVGLSPALISAPAVFLQPGQRPRLPLTLSMAGAACMGGLLALLFVTTAMELFALLQWSAQDSSPARLLMHPVPLLVAWLVSGALWALLFRSAGQHRTPSPVDRAVRWLFAGSLVEMALAAPTFAMASRRDSCFCGWMSWWGVVIGSATLFLLCGPMLLLLRTYEARVQWMRSSCPKCGYPQRSRGDRCSECGHMFHAAAQ